jgi:hypothetical protein
MNSLRRSPFILYRADEIDVEVVEPEKQADWVPNLQHPFRVFTIITRDEGCEWRQHADGNGFRTKLLELLCPEERRVEVTRYFFGSSLEPKDVFMQVLIYLPGGPARASSGIPSGDRLGRTHGRTQGQLRPVRPPQVRVVSARRVRAPGLLILRNLLFAKSRHLLPFPFDNFVPFTKGASEIGSVGIFIQWLVHHHPFLIIRMERKKRHFIRITFVVPVHFTYFWCGLWKHDDVAFHAKSIADWSK